MVFEAEEKETLDAALKVRHSSAARRSKLAVRPTSEELEGKKDS